jgi:NAD(P)H-hydrate epimerase
MPKSLSASAVRELDRAAIHDRGVPSLLLMENAGRAVAAAVMRKVERGAEPILVLVGPGNNGGDGLVIARTLANRGFVVRVHFIGPIEKLRELSNDTQTNARLWRDLAQPGAVVHAGKLVEVNTAADVAALTRELEHTPLVVDAMFGTGLVRELRTPWREVVLAVNAESTARPLPVVAVDVPSGLCADTGDVLGVAVEATTTVTFVAPKHGFFRNAGPAHVGKLAVVEIGIPRDLVRAALIQPAGKEAEADA